MILTPLVDVELRAQALEKGDFDVKAGLGFGVYSLSSNEFEDNSGAGIAGLINVSGVYQFSNAFSAGLDFERNGFATDQDSNQRARSLNFGFVLNYNLLNAEKNVIQPFLQFGWSNFTFDNYDQGDYVQSRGSYFQLGLTWKHYFTDGFGMFVNASCPWYSYNEFQNSKGQTYEISRNTGTLSNPDVETRVFQVHMMGLNVRTGLAFKF